jgi:hypothetical protein
VVSLANAPETTKCRAAIYRAILKELHLNKSMLSRSRGIDNNIFAAESLLPQRHCGVAIPVR